MGLHQGAPRLKPPSFHYPKGDESQGWRPVPEQKPMTKKDSDDHAHRYLQYVINNVDHRLLNARSYMQSGDKWVGPMAGYIKAYGEVVRCLALEPSPKGNADTEHLRQIFWDLKGIRAAMEATQPAARVDLLMGDLRARMEWM